MRKVIKLLKNQKQFLLKCEGTSMLPILQPSDIVFFRKVSPISLQVDDIVLVQKNRKTFTHRIIYKNKTYFITKGDNSSQSDREIHSHQILGKAYQVRRDDQVLHIENIYLMQSSLYFREVVKIKKAFEEEKIDFVFLKGLPLHLYFEKSHPRRVYADCDVLVAKRDSHAAEKVLGRFGYQNAETAFSPVHKLLKDKPTEYVFYKKINNFGVNFDLHLEVVFLMNQLGKLEVLYSQKLIDEITKEFLKEKKIIKIQNEYFPILSPANLMIYLALHFFHHNYQGIFRLEFLDTVIRKSLQVLPPRRSASHTIRGAFKVSLTPGVFLSLTEKMRTYKLQNFVYPVFLFLKKYYQTPLPDLFLNSIKPDKRKLNYIRKNILNINIFDGETRITAGINRFKNIFYLSPYSLIRKILVFFNPQVIYSFFWVMIFLVRRSFTRVSKSF